MDEAESSQEYYQFDALDFLDDSCFIQSECDAQYGNQRVENFGGTVTRITQWCGQGPTTPVPQYTAPVNYQHYQLQDPMDLNFLSAENYQEGNYGQASSGRRTRGSTQLYGGLLASSPPRASTRSPPATMRATRPSKKDAPTNAITEENGTRQRGRARLNTRDQTAAEVRLLVLPTYS